MNHLPLITKREYLNKVKNKSFIIMTFVSPLIMIGLGLLIGFLTNINKNKERIIDIVDESGFAKEIFSDTTSSTKYRILNNIDLSIYKDKYVIIKGCANKPVPQSAYLNITNRLIGVAKSVMYGEACSSVPLYKKR